MIVKKIIPKITETIILMAPITLITLMFRITPIIIMELIIITPPTIRIAPMELINVQVGAISLMVQTELTTPRALL